MDNTQRKNIMFLVLNRNNKLHELKIILSQANTLIGIIGTYKLLQTEPFNSTTKASLTFPFTFTSLLQEKAEIISQIQSCQKFIASRIGYLLDGKTFGEIYETTSGQKTLISTTITKEPINFISTQELNQGFIVLNELVIENNQFTGRTLPLIFTLKDGKYEVDRNFIE